MNSIQKSDEKEKLVYFSIIDNRLFKTFIENIENFMTILIKNIDFPESSTKFQEFLKHGFIFKCSGSFKFENKDTNFLQKFLKYYMITG